MSRQDSKFLPTFVANEIFSILKNSMTFIIVTYKNLAQKMSQLKIQYLPLGDQSRNGPTYFLNEGSDLVVVALT